MALFPLSAFYKMPQNRIFQLLHTIVQIWVQAMLLLGINLLHRLDQRKMMITTIIILVFILVWRMANLGVSITLHPSSRLLNARPNAIGKMLLILLRLATQMQKDLQMVSVGLPVEVVLVQPVLLSVVLEMMVVRLVQALPQVLLLKLQEKMKRTSGPILQQKLVIAKKMLLLSWATLL